MFLAIDRDIAVKELYREKLMKNWSSECPERILRYEFAIDALKNMKYVPAVTLEEYNELLEKYEQLRKDAGLA